MENFFPQPKPPKKEKKPYRGLQAKKPLTAKTPLTAKSSLKPKAPIYGEKREKKKKAPEKVKREGTKLPSRSSRNEFTEAEKRKIDKAFGGAKCAQCGNPYIEYHHAKFRSPSAQGSGRGVWRNGVPLCKPHHDLCHESRSYAEKWRALLKSLYGKYYYMDKYDLWLAGLIEEPENNFFEEFMIQQAQKEEI